MEFMARFGGRLKWHSRGRWFGSTWLVTYPQRQLALFFGSCEVAIFKPREVAPVAKLSWSSLAKRFLQYRIFCRRWRVIVVKRIGLAFAIGLIIGLSIDFFTWLGWPWIELEKLADVSNKLLTWPFVILCALLIFVFFPNVLKSIPFSKVDFWGTKFEFSREKAEEVSLGADELFSGVSKKVDAAFQLNSSRMQLEECFRRTMEAIKSKIGTDKWPDGFRATVHISDVVYGETLYQLLDYFPKGDGKGRRKSIRFGIIGLAFRSERDQLEPDLQNSKFDLVKGWGMTGHEAAYAGGERRAFACFILRDVKSIHSTISGLLYMDANEAGDGRLFKKTDPTMTDDIGHDIRAICTETKLLEKLASLKEIMVPYATDFKVHN
jgi:hypothetical protein